MMEHENKNRNSNGLLRRIVIAVLLVIMIGSALSLVKDWRDAAAQRRLEESLAEAAKQTETEPPETEQETEAETEAPYVSPIDFTPLLETNPDTIGWIRRTPRSTIRSSSPRITSITSTKILKGTTACMAPSIWMPTASLTSAAGTTQFTATT